VQSTNFNILNILFIINYSYLLLSFISYFDFYNLKTLRILTLITLIGEVLRQVFYFTNVFIDLIPEILNSAISIIIIAVEILWIFYVIRLPKDKYRGVSSLRKYSIAIIVTFIVSIAFSMIVILLDYASYYKIFYLALSLPFIYTIDFALKLKTTDIGNQATNSAST
jgi:hypothetical protein